MNFESSKLLPYPALVAFYAASVAVAILVERNSKKKRKEDAPSHVAKISEPVKVTCEPKMVRSLEVSAAIPRRQNRPRPAEARLRRGLEGAAGREGEDSLSYS